MEGSKLMAVGKEFHTVGEAKEKQRRACSFLMNATHGGYWMNKVAIMIFKSKQIIKIRGFIEM